MMRSARSAIIKALARQRPEDYLWGMPESPEFSAVQGLMNEFQLHASHEERWLSSYKESAKQSSDPLIRFLLNLIVADEERHHDLTNRMVAKLKDELAWTRSQAAAHRPVERGDKRKRLLRSVEDFIAAERKGIKEYERLKKMSKGLYREVFVLLYTTMIHDSHKHIGILEFLSSKLTESQRSAGKRKT